MKYILIALAALFVITAPVEEAQAQGIPPIAVFWTEQDSMFDDSGCPDEGMAGGNMCYVQDITDTTELGLFVWDPDSGQWELAVVDDLSSYVIPPTSGFQTHFNGVSTNWGNIYVGTFVIFMTPNAWDTGNDPWCLDIACDRLGNPGGF